MSSADAAGCEYLFQLFRPTNNYAQMAAVRAPAQHDEPPLASQVVVCDRGILPEVVIVGEQRDRFSECGFGSRGADCGRHHLLASTIEDLPAGGAPPWLHAASFGY